MDFSKAMKKRSLRKSTPPIQMSYWFCIGVGGLLDFASGRIPRAPLWMRKAKLEWVYRLRQEPIRLFKRYVIGNPLFLWRIYTHNS